MPLIDRFTVSPPIITFIARAEHGDIDSHYATKNATLTGQWSHLSLPSRTDLSLTCPPPALLADLRKKKAQKKARTFPAPTSKAPPQGVLANESLVEAVEPTLRPHFDRVFLVDMDDAMFSAHSGDCQRLRG